MPDTASPIVSLIPGPTSVHPEVLAAMRHDYDFGHSEDEHLPLYHEIGEKLKIIAAAPDSSAVIMSGEGMLALWSALKSCLRPGDSVLSVGNGVFGDGIGEMARSIGCRVEAVSFPYNTTFTSEDLEKVEAAARRCRPVMLTAVHCETPSGTLNPLDGLAEIKKRLNIPLFYVDAVASLGGAPVLAQSWNIDLLLGGTQKCFSAPPSMCFVMVSPTAWDFITRTAYAGYDALLPFKTLAGETPFPYTPYRQGAAALNKAADLILAEGLPQVFARHQKTAEHCRNSLKRLGFALFTTPTAINSPTVTAVNLPPHTTWTTWRRHLRAQGLVIAGSLGPMTNKVFRLGHMGHQASLHLIDQALSILAM